MGYKRYRSYYNKGIIDLILEPIINTIKPNIKGAIGELSIGLFLGLLDQSKYKIINNIIIESKGKTHQIDHIVISNYGIFVIETKNYKGIIFGNDDCTYWAQVLFGSKQKLYNPVWQNFGHIQAIKEKIGEYYEVPYYSIIVFSEEAELEVNCKSVVGYPGDMLEYIKSCNTVTISDVQKEVIYIMLNQIKQENRYLKQEHINNLKNNLYDKEIKIQNNVCPKCGNSLIQRNSKYGSFMGCTNYPKCKFTLKKS